MLAYPERLYYYLNMHSNNSTPNQTTKDTGNRSFIEQARRTQIIEATITVLANNGYVGTSFARIAKTAGISASLISYHFNNKEELTAEVYRSVNTARMENVRGSLAGNTSAADTLRAVIEGDLTYMGTRPNLFKAMVEVLFSAKESKNFAELMDGTEQSMISIIEDTLKKGQKSGEFGAFDAHALALIIDGARDQFLAQLPMQPDYDLETFVQTLTDLILTYVHAKEK
jgi:TetR/AcrR family fatty acid metabolism transcriptional regulator